MITRTSVTAHTEDYAYDELDRILSASYGPSDSVSWTYDENGNHLTQTSGSQVTNFVYNEVDWLTETTGAFVSASQYDDAGNRIGVCYTSSCSTPTDLFGYDWKGRTVSATVSGQSVSYEYTGDDIRASRTEGGTTNYLWDRQGLVPLLIGDGTTDRIFLEGQVLEEAGSSTSYPLTDALRSVRLTTDAAGAASGAVDFDVWGNVRSGTPGQLGWTGEMQDPTTGQVHLRARDYSPGTGRFTSRDTLVPNASGTNGYNPYWYANNNPASLTDPTGHVAGTIPLSPPRPCPICTPIAKGVMEGFAAIGKSLADLARAALRNPGTALIWAGTVFFLVATILTCILSPLCHIGASVVTGRAIDAVEEAKRQIPTIRPMTVALIVGVIAAVDACFSNTTTLSSNCLPEPRCRYSDFTAGRFRKNLACFTGILPPWGPPLFDAHHVFPKKFESRFDAVPGIGTIHLPWYGMWVFRPYHRIMNWPYQERWREFLAEHPPGTLTAAAVLQYGRITMADFGLPTFF